ncbi:MAG TPA: 30S ribosomal protein S9 [Verrucomicrobiales bacterium]|nr:30S ribosomal protein S9 [Verrucomicrobiales bacterium]
MATAPPVHSSIGRRKTAVARLRLRDGSGRIVVNDRPLEDYFPTISLQNQILGPMQVAQCRNRFDVDVRLHGGGITGQVGALRLALARALVDFDANLRGDLKRAGLLRRDPRMKERKKAGRPGARKRFQFSKR